MWGGPCRANFLDAPFQLSVYTTTRSNLGAENNVDLVLNVEDFDVESKFERYDWGAARASDGVSAGNV